MASCGTDWGARQMAALLRLGCAENSGTTREIVLLKALNCHRGNISSVNSSNYNAFFSELL